MSQTVTRSSKIKLKTVNGFRKKSKNKTKQKRKEKETGSDGVSSSNVIKRNKNNKNRDHALLHIPMTHRSKPRPVLAADGLQEAL